ASRRPVILAGRGAVWSDARGALDQLADRIGAVVTTTLLAKSFFRGHPYDVGVAGGFALPAVAEILREADLVLSFGASLSKETSDHGETFGGAYVVQVETNPVLASDQTVADEVVLGDARL